MKKLLIALVLILPCAVNAQLVTSELTRELPIQKLPNIPASDKELADARCGDYFLHFPGMDQIPPGARIAYFIQQPPSAKKGERTNMAMAFLRMKFRVLVDNSKKSPTSQIVVSRPIAGELRQDDENSFRATFNPNDIDEIIIRISAADLKKVKCLPKPSEFR